MPRLFFDERWSEELCKTLADIFSGSLHVRLLGQGGAADATVWDLARQHGCLVVSKDEDFHRLVLLRGAPPKFVWIRLGNCTTADIEQLLRRHHDDIKRSTSRTTRQSSSWAEYSGRPNSACTRRRCQESGRRW